MRTLPWLALAAASLLTVGAQAQQEPMDGGGIVAHLPDDERIRNPWNFTADELETRFPTVARAIRQVGEMTYAKEGEHDSMAAFFQEIGQHDGIRVGDESFRIVAAMYMGEPIMAPDEVTTQDDATPSGEASGLVAPVVLGLVAAVAILGARRRQ